MRVNMDNLEVSCETISVLRLRIVQPVGLAFISHFQGLLGGRTLDDCESEEEVDDSEAKIFDEDNVNYLRSLDPLEWKDQDHYTVLGLSKLRDKATEEDIKRAYRMKVLLHHPDKRRSLGEDVRPEGDYFICVTRAWEILGNRRNRRSYDSVDPTFDNTIPSNNEQTKAHFYEIFGNVFERNSKWSENTPVPQLGGPDSSRDSVEKFYQFWYNFESWREFSYLDEEDKEKVQMREERKWIDKTNKATRAKLKKEEMARIRNLVDTAYTMDPRIIKFKQEDKDKKLAMKQAKRDAARARQEEDERKQLEAEEAERKMKAEIEAEEKAKQDAIKAERDAQKKALKTQRSALRKVVKANDYYVSNEEERVSHMESLEKLCEILQINEIEELVLQLSAGGREVYLKAIKDVESKIEEERQAILSASQRCAVDADVIFKKGSAAPWTHEQLQLLIKAVNLFPAATNQRWEVVAKFINQHDSSNVQRTAKEVLSKAKDLQSSDYTKNILKITANQKAYSTFEKEHSAASVGSLASQRYDTPAEQQGVTPWTAAEQQLLEQALKTYPTTTPERWDKIAECLPSRSKKECMRRYKELAEMIKAKKAAQVAAATNTNIKKKS